MLKGRMNQNINLSYVIQLVDMVTSSDQELEVFEQEDENVNVNCDEKVSEENSDKSEDGASFPAAVASKDAGVDADTLDSVAKSTKKLVLYKHFLQFISQQYPETRIKLLNFYLALIEWDFLHNEDIDRARLKSLEIHKRFCAIGSKESVKANNFSEKVKAISEGSYGVIIGELAVIIRDTYSEFKKHPFYRDYKEFERNLEEEATTARSLVGLATRKDLEPLDTILFKNDFKMLLALCEVTPYYYKKEFSGVLTSILHSAGEVIPFTRITARKEISECNDSNTLFRDNTITTQVLTTFVTRVSSENLKEFLRNSPLNAIARSKTFLELDPSRVKSEKILRNNIKETKKTISLFLIKLEKSQNLFPLEAKVVCRVLKEMVGKKFRDVPDLPQKVVGGFLFLRIMSPTIMNPETYGIEDLSSFNSRSLLFMAKIIQCLSNHVLFGKSEEHLMVLNKFLERKFSIVDEFLENQIASRNETLNCSGELPPLVSEDMSYLIMQLEKNMGALKLKMGKNDNTIAMLESKLVSSKKKWPLPQRRDRELEAYFKKYRNNTELNLKFNKIFGLSREELSLACHCSIEGSVPMHGHLYVSKNTVCFSGGMFAIKRKEIIFFRDINIIEPTSYGKNVLNNTQIMIKTRANGPNKKKMFIFNFNPKEIPRKHVYSILKFHWRDAIENPKGVRSVPSVDSLVDSESDAAEPAKQGVFNKLKRRASFSNAAGAPASANTSLSSLSSIVSGGSTSDEDIQIEGESWDSILKISRELQFGRNELILEAGYASNSLYTITEGSVRVQILKNESRTVLREMNAGDIFAEMSFLDGSPVSADIVADSDNVCVVMIAKADVDAIASIHPSFAYSLYAKLGRTIAERAKNSYHLECISNTEFDGQSYKCLVHAKGILVPGIFSYNKAGIYVDSGVFGISVLDKYRYMEIDNVELDEDYRLCIEFKDKAKEEEIIEFDSEETVKDVIKNIFFHVSKSKYYENKPSLCPQDALDFPTTPRNEENSANEVQLMRLLEFLDLKKVSENRIVNLHVSRTIYFICKGSIELIKEKKKIGAFSIVGAHQFLSEEKDFDISAKTLENTILVSLSEGDIKDLIHIGDKLPIAILRNIDRLLCKQLREMHS